MDPLLNKFFTALFTLHGKMITLKRKIIAAKNSPKQYVDGVEELFKLVDHFGQMSNHYNRLLKNKTTAESVQDVVKCANFLDESGAYALADKFTEVAALMKYAYLPSDLLKKKDDEGMMIQPPNKGSLSTRHCPDHIGVQLFRIAEGIYQCPMDGKEYNFQTGFINYKGETVPGGSVSQQTPTSSNYGGVPAQIYDRRYNVINNIG